MLGINDIDTSAALDVSGTCAEYVVLVGLCKFSWFRSWLRRLVRSRTLRQRRRRSRSIHLDSLKVVVFYNLLRDELLLVVHAEVLRRLRVCTLLQSKDSCADESRDQKTRNKKKEQKEVALRLAPLVDIRLGTDRDSLVEQRLLRNCCKVNNIVNCNVAGTAEFREPVLDVLLERSVLGDFDGSPNRLARKLGAPDVVSDALDTVGYLELSDVARITLGCENSEVSIALDSVLEAIRTLEILNNSLLSCSRSKIDLSTAGSSHNVHIKRWISLGTSTNTLISLELHTEEESGGLSRDEDATNEAAKDSLARSSEVRTDGAASRNRDSGTDTRARNSRLNVNRDAQGEAYVVSIVVTSVLDGNGDVSKTAVLRSKELALELKTSLSKELHRPAELEPGTLSVDSAIRKVLSLDGAVGPVESIGSNTSSNDRITRLT